MTTQFFARKMKSRTFFVDFARAASPLLSGVVPTSTPDATSTANGLELDTAWATLDGERPPATNSGTYVQQVHEHERSVNTSYRHPISKMKGSFCSHWAWVLDRHFLVHWEWIGARRTLCYIGWWETSSLLVHEKERNVSMNSWAIPMLRYESDILQQLRFSPTTSEQFFLLRIPKIRRLQTLTELERSTPLQIPWMVRDVR